MRLLPELTPANEWFWKSGADGRLRVQGCRDCRTLVHPPALLCPRCRSRAWEPVAVSGRGVVAGYTVNAHPGLPGFDPLYVVAVVALEESPDVRLRRLGRPRPPEAGGAHRGRRHPDPRARREVRGHRWAAWPNPHGGQLSEGRTHGFGFLYEAVAQLRHEAGERQVAGARTAVVTNGGGTPSGVLLLQRDGV